MANVSIDKDLLISKIEDSWKNPDMIKMRLAQIRQSTFPQDGNKAATNFVLELSKKLGVSIPDNLSDNELGRLGNMGYAILAHYGVPKRPKDFELFMADIAEKARELAPTCWEDVYGKFIVPKLPMGLAYDLIKKGKNVWMKGPKGCGKTEMGKILFGKVLNIPFETLDVYPDLAKMDLEGRDVISVTRTCARCGHREFESITAADGLIDIKCKYCGVCNQVTHSRETRWQDGILARAARNNRSLLINEIDAAGEDLSTGLMELLQDHKFTITQTGETFHCDQMGIYATANTGGHGSTDQYNRQQQDSAMMSRFVKIHMEYLKPDVETQILIDTNPIMGQGGLGEKAVKFANSTREGHKNNAIADLVSTRELVNFALMYGINERWDIITTVKCTLCNIFQEDDSSFIYQLASQIFGISETDMEQATF